MDKITELLRLVSDSVDRIENTFSQIVKSLTGVFRVKLEDSEVKVSNQEEVTKAIDQINVLLERIGNKKHTVEVSNQISIPDKTDVTVLNPTKTVEVSNFPTPPSSLNIGNLDTLTGLLTELRDLLLQPLSLDHTDPEKKLAVRLVDSSDEFYDVMFRGTNSQGIIGATDRLAPLLIQIRQAIENIDISIDVGELTVAMDTLEDLTGKEQFRDWSAQTVSGNATQLLATGTVPTGKKYLIKGWYGEGNNDGLFILTVDDVEIWRGRNAWTNRSLEAHQDYYATAGQVIELSVVNQRSYAGSFSGGFYAYVIG